MDKNKEPGILFNKIFLSKCNFKKNSMNSKMKEAKLKFDFRINNRMNNEKTKLLVEFETMIGKDEEQSPIYLDVIVAGEFSINETEKNLDLEEFSKFNAPAIIFPYVREFISDLTTRAGFNPPIILPPMNIINMIKNIKNTNN